MLAVVWLVASAFAQAKAEELKYKLVVELDNI